MMTNPVGWFEIYVDDMPRARAFYEGVFNIQLESMADPAPGELGAGLQMLAFPAHIEHYGASGALCKMEGFAAGGNSTIVYFSCDDCAVEQARAEPLGGSVFQSKFAIGEHGFIALISDTEGNMIGLHSMS